MRISNENLKKLEEDYHWSRFDNRMVDEDGKRYFFFIDYSIFLAQTYRVYSLLLQTLGVKTAIYDYIELDDRFLMFTNDICMPNETLIETNDLPEPREPEGYFDYLTLWEEWMRTLPLINPEENYSEFYKQWFVALLINDEDKQISLIKDKNGFIRVGDYFDYGGVYFIQDQQNDVDNNIYFIEEEKQEFFMEYPHFNEEKLHKDLEKVLHKTLLDRYLWEPQNSEILTKIYPLLDKDFIDKCLTININSIMDNDKKHTYSNNYREVINSMFEKSRNSLKSKIDELNLTTTTKKAK